MGKNKKRQVKINPIKTPLSLEEQNEKFTWFFMNFLLWVIPITVFIRELKTPAKANSAEWLQFGIGAVLIALLYNLVLFLKPMAKKIINFAWLGWGIVLASFSPMLKQYSKADQDKFYFIVLLWLIASSVVARSYLEKNKTK